MPSLATRGASAAKVRQDAAASLRASQRSRRPRPLVSSGLRQSKQTTAQCHLPLFSCKGFGILTSARGRWVSWPKLGVVWPGHSSAYYEREGSSQTKQLRAQSSAHARDADWGSVLVRGLPFVFQILKCMHISYGCDSRNFCCLVYQRTIKCVHIVMGGKTRSFLTELIIYKLLTLPTWLHYFVNSVYILK